MEMDKDNLKTIGITVIAMASSFAIKKAMAEGYRNVYDEDPPDEAPEKDFSWGSIITWTVVTGVTAAATKLLVKKMAAKKVEG